MEVGVKFRAYPTQKQKVIFSKWMGCSRFIYNAKCDEDKYFRIFSSKALSLIGKKPKIDQKYSHFKSKELSPWLYEVPSQILRNASVRWYDAYKRFFKNLSQRPTRKSKYGRQSVWVTSELFYFRDNKLYLGTKTKDFGVLKIKAHRKFQLPKSITISKQAGCWYVSFCYNDLNLNDSKPEDIFSSLGKEDFEYLNAKTVGIDRGISIPFATSDNISFNFSTSQEKHIIMKEKKRKKHQKKMARQKKGSNRRERTKNKISKCYQKVTHIRQDFAHKTSSTLIKSEYKIFSFESLKVKNMIKKPKKVWSDIENRYMPNKAKAKAGLNKRILDSAWRRTLDYVVYKARQHGKIVIEVASHFSSQTCAACQHTCSSNRKTQESFICISCGHKDNADYNAAKVVKQRGMRAIFDQDFSCVVGGTSKTKNGRGAKEKISSKKKSFCEISLRKETSKEKNLSAIAV